MVNTRAIPNGFDTSLPGTPLSCWEALERPHWNPQQLSLIVVAPHPDDETLGAGGLIYRYAKRQLRVTVVSVTDGEAACPEVTALAGQRRAELRAALATLGAHQAQIIRLGLPDGRVEGDSTVLLEALRSITSPDSLVAAPFEQDGHPDHDATGRVAREVADEQGLTLAAYPIWAWHQATPEVFSGRRMVSLPLNPEARAAKHNAIRCYVSQLRERTGGSIVPPHVLHYFDRPYEAFLL